LIELCAQEGISIKEWSNHAFSFRWEPTRGPVLSFRIKTKIYSLMICHRKPERSFKIKGHALPLCARCTGLIIGSVIGILLVLLSYDLPLPFLILSMLPLLIDGFTQMFTTYESNNILRFSTGVLFSLSLVYLEVMILW
jgi:uncharacterized membrane protein